jgi:lipoic acid synthetase
MVDIARLPKPDWLKKRIPSGQACTEVSSLLRDRQLHTVCQEAHCPNLGECFSRGTATFMILGDRCTRNCNFCAVHHDSPLPPDEGEPQRVAMAVEALGLRYVVITSVTRDDQPDGGALHFAKTIRSIRDQMPNTRMEVLIPDFQGSEWALKVVMEAKPDVINHNIETVPRLYPEVRPQADYRRSLQLLTRCGEMDGRIVTKSGLMLGLGENPEEVLNVLKELLESGCQLLTLGQYLSPSSRHHQVIRFVPPEEFRQWGEVASRMGFMGVASGTFVRSSFKAAEMFQKAFKNINLDNET